MDSILNKHIVKLNKVWQAFETISVEKAIGFLTSENPTTGERPGLAMDYETVVDENGEQVLVYSQPVTWEEWVKLPVRAEDWAIGIGNDPVTGAARQIRCPLVVICGRYDKVPEKKARLSNGAVHERDGYVDQYTGEQLTRATASIDHIIPRSKGGRDEWGNLVTTHKKRNQAKGNRFNHEIGYKLIRKPAEPKPTVKLLKAADATHPSQVPFLLK